ncbi:MAG: competence/damage-inducible protein A [Alphaproteobacteria bacterium]|nr:competence/damage-inducible protein A [Alphaproteobacteria bacterium]
MTTPTPNPTAAMLVIGDEILSGRTTDANLVHLAHELSEAAIELKEVRVVADDHDDIVAAVRALSARWDHIFTSGGIGPTHDDITAEAIAGAFGVAIDVRDDARALLGAYYRRNNVEFNAARMRMARIPEGAVLIDNPISVAPGFTLGNVHVMAGVPAIFCAMVASVLPTLMGGAPMLSRSFRIDRPEGDFAAELAEIALLHQRVAIGSYPFVLNGHFGSNIVFRSIEAAALDLAAEAFCMAFPMARK